MPVVKPQKSGVATKPSSAKGVLARISPIGFDKSQGIKVLLYGLSGTGKTTLWGTFPGRILSVIVSGGKKNPGELRSLDTAEYRKKVDHVVLESADELADISKFLRTSGKYQTAVIDHVTGFQDLKLAEILGIEMVPVQKSWGLASQKEYGQLSNYVKESLRDFLDFNGNSVVIAQERVFGGGEDAAAQLSLDIPYVGAACIPSVTNWLNTAVDYICQTYKRQKTRQVETTIGTKKVVTTEKTKGVEYCLRTSPDSVFMTKFRAPKGSIEVPECIVDPTYEKIMDVIQGRS